MYQEYQESPFLPRPSNTQSVTPARAALPGPTLHSPHGDITAVLMRMVELGVLSAEAAQLVAWARSLSGVQHGAYFNAACRPRVVYLGHDWDAAAFSDTHARSERETAPSTQVPLQRRLATQAPQATQAQIATPFTFGASTAPREWLLPTWLVEDTAAPPESHWRSMWRATGAFLAYHLMPYVIFTACALGMVALLALAYLLLMWLAGIPW